MSSSPVYFHARN